MRDSLSYRIVRVVVLTALGLFTVFPLWVLIDGSLSTSTAAGGVFNWIPSPINWASYTSMWTTVPLLHYLLNSLVVASVSMLVSVPIGILAAYAITRYRVWGAGAIMRVVLATQVVPGVVFLLPLFVLYASAEKNVGLQLDGTYVGLVLTYLTFALPFSIWLLTRYLSTVPRDVEEAAMVDGAGRLRAFFHTTLRLSLPGVAAVSVYTFITAWGEVLFASVLTSAQTRTLPIGLEDYESAVSGVVNWNQLMAASLTVSVPVVLGFLLVQRFVVRGLSAGAVK